MLSQYEAAQNGQLLGWTIYGPTSKDFPGFYVARAWVTGPRREPRWPFVLLSDQGRVAHAFVGCLTTSIMEARKCVGQEFTHVGRAAGDEPQIIESWV